MVSQCVPATRVSTSSREHLLQGRVMVDAFLPDKYPNVAERDLLEHRRAKRREQLAHVIVDAGNGTGGR